MKKLFAILSLAVLALATPIYAQQQDNVQVDVTKLTSEQLRVYQQLKAMQNNASTVEALTPEKVDKYAQMGKGIGIAVNEGLSAVTKNVEQFCQTSAGKWLMVLITWKVMGNDAVDLTRTLIQWLVGGFLLVVGVPVWVWITYRNCVQKPILSIEKTGFWSKKITFDENRRPLHEDWTVAYGLLFFCYLGAIAAIMFIH